MAPLPSVPARPRRGNAHRRVALTLTLLASCAPSAPTWDGPEEPNIVLILTDDQGWSQLSERADPELPESCSSYLETPHIARLMNEGVRFTGGYAPAPLCTPTRRSILCGTSAARSGTEFGYKGWIPFEHLTIPAALKAVNARYRCAHVGKWGALMRSTPEECGYDTSDGMTGNATGGVDREVATAAGNGTPYFLDNDDPKRTRTTTDRAIDFMETQAGAGSPFFVQVSYYASHLPIACSQDALAKYEGRGAPDRAYPPAYAAMIEELDDGVGRLLDAVDQLGITKNTYVVFLSDNGGLGKFSGLVKQDGQRSPNFPLSGAKNQLHEGGVRVPFAVRGPGIAAGSVCRVPVVGYDLLPTLHALVGGHPDALTPEVDGSSLLPLFQDPSGEWFDRPSGGIFFHRPARLVSAIRADEYKLILHWTKTGELRRREMYRVDVDPRESAANNLAGREPGKADALQAVLVGHLQAVGAEEVGAARGAPAERR